MALSAFDDKAKPPREEDLVRVLDKAFPLWNDLKNRMTSRFAPLQEEWGCSSKSTGWGLRLKGEKRTVLYMTPCRGYFMASFALGEKAVRAAHEGGLPAPVLEIIAQAKKYAEGRGVRLEVRSAQDVLDVERLAIIKMAN